ncbi:MAG: hypothetical protein RJA44_32 [Pseudomonadota bacterium]
MHMLYNSDNFAVVRFEAPPASARSSAQGGYEIVDKHARREIYLEGALAERFKQGVEDLIRSSPTEEEIDDYLEGYALLAQQPVLMH